MMKLQLVVSLLFISTLATRQTFKGKVQDDFGVPISRVNVLDIDTPFFLKALIQYNF